jgi:hypothetical protein
MNPRLMVWPMVGLAALTFVVWLRMYVMRVAEMRRERIDPQSIANSAAAAERLRDTRASDNFRNLFELPVLFYAAAVVAIETAQVGVATLALGWTFVALRAAHSAIQCSYNGVMHRFAAYVAGGAVLWTLWLVLAIGLLR